MTISISHHLGFGGNVESLNRERLMDDNGPDLRELAAMGEVEVQVTPRL